MNDNQFDERFKVPPRHSHNPGAAKRSRHIAKHQRALQAEVSRRPANIAWFEDALEAEVNAERCTQNAEEKTDADEPVTAASSQHATRNPQPGTPPSVRPLIGYFCNLVPQEIILALGALPVRLGCGNAALVQPGEEVLAGDVCPLAKASFASLLDPESRTNRCQAFVVPTSCDAKTKLGEILADYRPTFTLNLPREQDAARYASAAAEELERMADFLAGALGRKKLATADLLAAIRLGRERTRIVRELQDVRSAQPAALSVRDFFSVIQASFAGVDLHDWCAEAEKVLVEARAFTPERPRRRHRVVLTGAPMIWPNFKVLNLLEECGADVVADTLCTGAQSCFDPVVIDETGRKSLFRALALRYIFASPCPCFVSQGTRLSRVLELAATHRAAGVVNYGLRLCQLFDLESYRLAQVLKAKQLPFLNLRTDYSLEDTEQLRIRLEAFLETLE